MNVLLYKQIEREILDLNFEISLRSGMKPPTPTPTTTSISTHWSNTASISSAAVPIFKCRPSIS